MSDPAPRRRRTTPPPPGRRGGGTGRSRGPWPWVALSIGVVIAGLGIGALISAYQNRGGPPPLVQTSGLPLITPVPQSSELATPVPTPSPTTSPSATPTARPTPRAPLAPTARPTVAPSVLPSATGVPSSAPSASAAPTPPPVPSASPHPTPAPTRPPTSPPTSPPTARPATPPPATALPPAGDADAAVVRRYLDALIAGNEPAAYAALGGTPADTKLQLKELAFVDKDARVTSLRVTHTDAGGSTVVAEISATDGNYVATFHVRSGPGGPIIDQHDYIKA